MINFDHNATTPLLPEVAAGLARAFGEDTANPSSIHRAGQRARQRLDVARAQVASLLHAEPRDIVFVGSGSEADALALKGVFFGRREAHKRRIVSSAQEHPAVLFALEQLRAHGAEVVLVRPDPDGRVSPEEMEAALTPPTLLCSLMWVNNETGVIQPVAEVARRCAARGVLFHTDAVQAVGKVPVSLAEVPADLLSLSGHKLGAPAGIGALVVRRGVLLESLLAGHQESGRRGGTPSLPFIEALALALASGVRDLVEHASALEVLRDALESKVLEALPGVRVNGGGERVSNTTNLMFPGTDGEALLIALDLAGVLASSGAACASGSLKASHVLTSMGRSEAEARSSLRFSLGRGVGLAEVAEVVRLLVAQVRGRPFA